MNNVYFIGMCVAMCIYLIIGVVISKKAKSAEEFYVAGRQASVVWIAGSMIASYTSTGMFMGDAAQCYEGVFSPIILFAGMQSAGYIIGAVFFGRYLRRSDILTIPAFFEKRFHSAALKKLAAIISIVTMTVYLLSVVQGIGTLMNVVTGVEYNLCIILAMIVFTIISVISGSKGVLVTDTLMACVFTIATLLAMVAISGKAGGWFAAIKELSITTPELLSWSGKTGDAVSAGPLGYRSGIENIIWGFTYGIVWMSVCMVGPWQSSRYLMAKNEHTIIRSSFVAAIGVFFMEFLTGMAAVMVHVVKPDISPSSHVLIWAAMNIMPVFLGVVLLTGALSAGISSATTFLSLIGASVANDLISNKEKDSVKYGKISMVIASMLILAIAIMNSPSIFWIMFLGGAIVASSWMPVVIACVFSKRLTKTGAFLGMLTGFVTCFAIRLYTALTAAELPAYLDPSIVGMVVNILFMIIGSAGTKVSPEEKTARELMFVIPSTEKDSKEIYKTLTAAKASVSIGVIIVVALLILWVLPYLKYKY